MAAQSNKTRTFAVIGLGRFGGTIATELARFGNRVLGIDTDETQVSRFAEVVTEAVIADGRDEQALKEAGVQKYDVVVVGIGENLEASILCTMNAKLLGVKTIWVKAQNRTHHRILAKLGADRVIQPEQELGTHIAQMLHNPMVYDYVSLGNGFHVYNMRIPERLAGRRLASFEFEEEFELRCLGMMRGSQYMNCDGSEPELREDDRLILLGKRPDLRKFADRH